MTESNAEELQRPLRRDAERNRRRILDAAAELFTMRGFGVSLDDVARHADVGVGTVYRRFPEKQSLIDALFEERMAEVVAVFDAGLADDDPWEGFVGALEGMLTLAGGDRGIWQLLLDGGHAGAGVARLREEIVPRSNKLLRRAQAAGVIRSDLEPTDLPILQLMLGSVVDSTRDIAPEVWRRYLQIVLDGLRPDRRKPTPLLGDALPFEQIDDVLRERAGRPPGTSTAIGRPSQ